LQTADQLQAELQQAEELLKQGDAAAAAAVCDRLRTKLPESPDVLILSSRLNQRRNRFDDMLADAERAAELAPGDPVVELRRLECLLYCGRPDKVLVALRALEISTQSDHSLFARLAEFYTHCTDHFGALRCLQTAVRLQPANSDYLFGLSAAQVAVGELRAAEKTLNCVIDANPDDYDAYRNRATVRRQTKSANHLDELHRALGKGVKRPAGEVQLCYALSKEYEDLGDFESAFSWLKRGADKRRSLLSYRVENDVAALESIMRCFDRRCIESATPGLRQAGPIFVMGLPRSGTTLIDRILSSHSQVASLGEVNDFAFSLMHCVGEVANKLELIERSASADFESLGRRYVDGIRNYPASEIYLIDKTPLNYLYLGLIHQALPCAKVIHVRRNPMDSCFGMYRTLFRAGYPFSYDFSDLAKYYIAYSRMMQHWRDVLGDWFMDVSYESLVDAQENVSRVMIEFCGLEWQEACLEVHRNDAPVATASSAQVRQPVYREALQRWRKYEAQLQPLAGLLRQGGIDIEVD
jgi:tetratricopeptide (TPR) repeat protein